MTRDTELNRYQRALEAAERRSGRAPHGAGAALLAFESGIERDYIAERSLDVLSLQRVTLLLAVAFYISFFSIDALFFRHYTQPWAWALILCVSTPLNVLAYALTYSKRAQPHGLLIGAALALVNAFVMALTSALGVQHGTPIPPEAAVIQQLYNVFLLGLPFAMAAPISVISISAFIGLQALVGMEASMFFQRSFMLVASGIVGLLACYLQERGQRLSWLRAQLLRELSEHDELTGLNNHRVFYQRGELLLRQSRRDRCGVAVLLIDVDYFKKFNDSYGHLAGDACLRQLAESLANAARRPLDVAARVGGEEFGLLLYNTSAADAHRRADALRNAVRGLRLPEGRRITVSIGCSHASGDDDPPSIETLVGAADVALYRAKAEGRDRVVG